MAFEEYTVKRTYRKYRYEEQPDGSLHIIYKPKDGETGNGMLIATIKDRKFRRVPRSKDSPLFGHDLSLVQTIAGYRALVEGKIGPL